MRCASTRPSTHITAASISTPEVSSSTFSTTREPLASNKICPLHRPPSSMPSSRTARGSSSESSACSPGTGSPTSALAMKAIHGGKAKNDKLDAQKIAGLLELGRRGRPRLSRLVFLGRDPAWPRCGIVPDPVAFGLAPSPASGSNARSLAIVHRCGPPAEPKTNYADTAVPERKLTGVSIPLRVPGGERSPSGGRAIVLSSRVRRNGEVSGASLAG
jgi:hypothetical protein